MPFDYLQITKFMAETVAKYMVTDITSADISKFATRINATKNKLSSDAQQAFNAFVEFLPEQGAVLTEIVDTIAQTIAFFIGFGNARAKPLLLKEEQKANASCLSGLPEINPMIWNYNHKQITDEQLVAWYEKNNFGEDASSQITPSMGLNLDITQWFDYYCRIYETLPTLEEINARYNFTFDTADKWLTILPKLPPLEYVVNFYNKNIAPFEQTDLPRSFADIGMMGFPEAYIATMGNLLEQRGIPRQYAEVYLDSLSSWPDASAVVRSMLLWGFNDADIMSFVLQSGVNPKIAWVYSDIARNTPSPLDLATVFRRFDKTDEEIKQELVKLSCHPNYLEVFNEITKYYPPVQDLITMSVREVFTPEIAKQYGQFEDYPAAFTEAANRAGLSNEWALNYWAAHWQLPSATQGFEMLHRGLINREDVSKLLRSLDYMPYWREKLIDLSYNVVGRIDIRRMYQTGVYTRAQVYQAYLKEGYSPEDATALTEYTVLQVLQTETGLSSKKVYTSYSKGLLTKDNALEYLTALGVPLQSAEMGLQREEIDIHLRHIDIMLDLKKTAYSRGKITDASLIGELTTIGITLERAQLYQQEWALDKQNKLTSDKNIAPNTAGLNYLQILDLFKGAYIDRTTADRKLDDLGYTLEDRTLLLDMNEPSQELME